MDKLDHAYLTDLVRRSRQGDSTAFAELSTATCQRHYAYLCEMLGDEQAAADTLKKALQDPVLLSGPVLLEIRCACGARPDLGRPTTTPLQNRDAFMDFLQSRNK